MLAPERSAQTNPQIGARVKKTKNMPFSAKNGRFLPCESVSMSC
jgi:hypothetical protein